LSLNHSYRGFFAAKGALVQSPGACAQILTHGPGKKTVGWDFGDFLCNFEKDFEFSTKWATANFHESKTQKVSTKDDRWPVPDKTRRSKKNLTIYMVSVWESWKLVVTGI
jgi:hypothetical protein